MEPGRGWRFAFIGSGHMGSKHQTKFLAKAQASGEVRALEAQQRAERTERSKKRSYEKKLHHKLKNFSKQFSSVVAMSVRICIYCPLHTHTQIQVFLGTWNRPIVPALRWRQV